MEAAVAREKPLLKLSGVGLSSIAQPTLKIRHFDVSLAGERDAGVAEDLERLQVR